MIIITGLQKVGYRRVKLPPRSKSRGDEEFWNGELFLLVEYGIFC
jgi:hypothetical protein